MNERTLRAALTEHCRRMANTRWNSLECTCGHVRGKQKDGRRGHAPGCPRTRKQKEQPK